MKHNGNDQSKSTSNNIMKSWWNNLLVTKKD
jgi:hypothetical protein